MTIERVLIVDDDEDVRQICEIAARKLGQWEVSLASGGEEALARVRAERPDVILLDVMMPGMDGPKTLSLLRDDPATADIPVIFLTAKAQRHEVEGFLALGATGVILKPFDVLTFADDIRRLVDGA
ncbi:MAG: response regulator [Myxococcota bacterium]|nr:response regulator [Myxococcota bacterium]